MAIFRNCCYCLDLQVGIAVLGTLSALVSILGISAFVVALLLDIVYINLNTISTFISVLLQFMADVCLIKAALVNNKRFLVPWLLITIGNLIFWNIILLYGYYGAEDIHVCTVTFLTDTFVVYFWLCVFAYYQELDEEGHL